MLSSKNNNKVDQICIFRFCQWKNLELNIQLSMNDFSVHRSQTSTLSFCLQQSFKSSIFKFWNFQQSLVYIVHGCRFPHHRIFTNLYPCHLRPKENHSCFLSQNHWTRRVRLSFSLSSLSSPILSLSSLLPKNIFLSQNHWSRRVRRGVRLSEGRHREDVRHEGEN